MIADPRDIPGLVLWLSAEAITGLADGATLTTWADLSGAGHNTTGVNGTPTWQATAGPAGGPAVRFPATDHYLTLPAILAGATAGEIMATVKAANAGAQQNSWKFGTATADPTNHYPFSNGTIYEDFGRTVRTSFSPAGVDLTAWHRYNVWSASGDWSARLNETVKAADANTGVGFAAAPKLGNVGTFATQPLHYGAVIVYSRKLTTTERADLAAWLTAHPSGGTLPPPPPPPPPPASAEWFTHDARSSALIGWSPTYGRGDSNAKATPIQVTVELAAARAGACPVIGERFRLTLSEASAAALGIETAEAVRFTGEVTDARVDPNRHPGGVYTITGVGRLGRASRRGLDPHWPSEDDGARVARILADADIEAGTIDPGTVNLLPALTKATVGQLLDRVMDSTLGQVIEQPTGAVDWHDAEHRRGTPVTLTLAASEIVNDLDWSQHVGDVINDLTVTYGNPADTVRAHDPSSIDARGAYPGSMSTDLVTASDAHSLGTLVVARRREPAWQLPALVLDLLRTVDAVKLAQLLAVRHGDRIKVTGFPAGGPYAGDVELFVEGWAETLVRPTPHNPRPRWRLALAVSDPVLSGVSLRWIDAPAALTWDQVDPTLTWLDVATLDNPADLGA